MTRRVEVDLRWRHGRDARVDVLPGETVLEAAERTGVGLPVGCRTGACGTCTGRLTRGSIRYHRPPRALKTRAIRDGFVLLCIAEPRENCQFDVGTDVQSQNVWSPWTVEEGPDS